MLRVERHADADAHRQCLIAIAHRPGQLREQALGDIMCMVLRIRSAYQYREFVAA